MTASVPRPSEVSPEGSPDLTATPFPAGWYAVAVEAELPDDGPWPTRLCGRSLILHPGATGRRSATLDGRPVPLQRHAGLLMAWFHPDGAAPDWRLQPLSEDPAEDPAEGWTTMTFTRQELAIRPLHVMRDLADLAHFETVHLYREIQVRQPLEAAGPRLHTAIDFGWDTGLPGLGWTVPAGFESRAEGPGYQQTDVRVPMGLWVSRHLVMPSPVDAERTALHLGLSIRLSGALGRLEQRLGARVMAPVKAAIHAFVARAYVRDIARDAELWRRLAAGRGPRAPLDPTMARFHRWAAQFC